MSEVVNVVVAVAVIVFIFKWATSGSSGNESGDVTARALGFRPKKITDEQVNTVVAMFPDIPRPNIHYELLRTGNVERTTNKILERGYLDAPPAAYFSVYPRTETPQPVNAAASSTATNTTQSKWTLISRYQLESRLAEESQKTAEDVGGKTTWEDSSEKREASLKERKAQMILMARQRMLAAQQQKQS